MSPLSEPMNNEPERKATDRARARLEALLKANAAPRCGARSKRTGQPCQGAAMPNGRCKVHGGKAATASSNLPWPISASPSLKWSSARLGCTASTCR
jgi:hypothetical protein